MRLLNLSLIHISPREPGEDAGGFPRKGAPQLPTDLEVLHVSHVGRIHTLIVRGNATDVTNRLAVYALILLEALPLTLEEIFIYELGGEDYEVRDIVLSLIHISQRPGPSAPGGGSGG